LDCSSGVSGDKFLGALLDAGSQTGQFTAEKLQAIAAALVPEAVVTVGKTSSYSISAVTVKVETCQGDVSPDIPDSPEHHHTHGRSWAAIRTLISSTPAEMLSPAARDTALSVFEHLAQVEAQVHGTTPDDVHFHEVGAADSIVDIVGVCAGLDALGITTLYATPPALGSGTVETQHGTLPVPAPATAALLQGLPTSLSKASGELTTPTGAALLGLAAGFGPTPPLTPYLLGYGAGTRDIGQPNICRLIVGEAEADALTAAEPDATVLLETNIDHITPEAVAFAGEELLAEGALDVWVTPIAMKKGRAALTLSVLTAPERAEQFAGRIMKLTGTLGVRVSEQPRLVAARETAEVDTPWGRVSLKIGSGRIRPEHEDVARIAREQGLDYPEVLATISACARKQLEA
jgi:uncharacterized protein (TIGR00299 family) protein